MLECLPSWVWSAFHPAGTLPSSFLEKRKVLALSSAAHSTVHNTGTTANRVAHRIVRSPLSKRGHKKHRQRMSSSSLLRDLIYRSTSAGRVTVQVVPCPGILVMSILPPWAFAILW